MIPSETQDMEFIVDCAEFEQTPTETTTAPTSQPDTPEPETGGIPGFPFASIALGSIVALAVAHRKPEI